MIKKINFINSVQKILSAKNYLTVLLTIFIVFIPLVSFSEPYEKGSIVRQIKTFNKVDIEGNFLVKIFKHINSGVEVIGNKKIIPFIIVTLESDTVYIRLTNDTRLSENEKLEIHIYSPDIIKVTAAGTANVFINDIDNQSFELKISDKVNTVISGKTRTLKISASGKSQLDTRNFKVDGNGNLIFNLSGLTDIKMINFKSEILKANLMDLSTLNLSGSSQNLELNAAGSSLLNAKGLKSINSVIRMDDCTEAEINVETKLTAYLSGSSSLKYNGNPDIIKQISHNSRLIHTK